MPEITIRRAGVADAQALSDIGRATFTETFGHLYPASDLAAFLDSAYGADILARTAADPAYAFWLAEHEGAPVGHALAGPCDLPHPEVTATCGEIKRLYLLKSHQNGGSGGRLFETLLAWLEGAGAKDLWLGVWSENHGAQRFYRRYGFAPVGEYGFHVGETIDREFIFRRRAQIF